MKAEEARANQQGLPTKQQLLIESILRNIKARSLATSMNFILVKGTSTLDRFVVGPELVKLGYKCEYRPAKDHLRLGFWKISW